MENSNLNILYMAIFLYTASMVNQKFVLQAEDQDSAFIAQLSKKTVKDWEIAGRFILEENLKPPSPGDLRWRLMHVRPAPAGNTSFNCGNARLNINLDGSFVLSPRDPEKIGSWLIKSNCVLGFYWDGRLATSAEFHVQESPCRINGLEIRFGSPERRVLRVRIVDPDTTKGIPNLNLRAYLSEDTFTAPALANLQVANATTDKAGALRLESMPQGNIKVIEADSIRMNTVAMPNGVWVDPVARYPTLTMEEAEKVSVENLPIVYYVPKGKGVFWDAILINVPQVGAKILSKGTVLQFTAKRPDDLAPSSAWDPNLVFKVTVGEESLVKTPVVPEGLYQVKSISGDAYEDEIAIFGMGSVWHVRRHEELKSARILNRHQEPTEKKK